MVSKKKIVPKECAVQTKVQDQKPVLKIEELEARLAPTSAGRSVGWGC